MGVWPFWRVGEEHATSSIPRCSCGSRTSTGCVGSRSPEKQAPARRSRRHQAVLRQGRGSQAEVSAGQNDPNANIWQEIQPLQVELNAGLFGDDSIYAKTIRRTLSPEQAARFESLARERAIVSLPSDGRVVRRPSRQGPGIDRRPAPAICRAARERVAAAPEVWSRAITGI